MLVLCNWTSGRVARPSLLALCVLAAACGESKTDRQTAENLADSTVTDSAVAMTDSAMALVAIAGDSTQLTSGVNANGALGDNGEFGSVAPLDTTRQARLARRTPRPDSVRALYVNAWASGSRSRMENLIRIADETEINAFIIDIKESDTYLSYKGTNIALAKEIGADQRPATTWLPALIDTLQAHRIFAIARIVVFKDRMLAEKRPELAIRHANGNVWKDNKGGPWVNPYDKRVWDYNIAIASEALDMGFGELQWDYVRFPDVTNSARAVMRYPGSDSISRADNIRNFIQYSKQQLAEYEVPVTADVFGLVTHAEGDVEIGQNWEKVTMVADAVLPMVYPSHYYAGLYGFARPIANPYEIVRLATADAVARNRWLADSAGVAVAEVMPWLEAMSIRGANFGATELRLQIQATYDSGLKSWALWNPGSKFAEFEAAFRPATGGLSPVELAGGWKAPEYELPRQRMSPLVRKREQATLAAREAAQKRQQAADSTRAAGQTPMGRQTPAAGQQAPMGQRTP